MHRKYKLKESSQKKVTQIDEFDQEEETPRIKPRNITYTVLTVAGVFLVALALLMTDHQMVKKHIESRNPTTDNTLTGNDNIKDQIKVAKEVPIVQSKDQQEQKASANTNINKTQDSTNSNTSHTGTLIQPNSTLNTTQTSNQQVLSQTEKKEPQYFNGMELSTYQIKRTINRNFNELFYTQGLMFINQTTLLESAGLYGQSSIHTIDIDQPDKIKVNYPMNATYFAEGCDIINNTIYQLTWREKTILTYNPSTLEFQSKFTQPKQLTSGWGITHRVKDDEIQVLLTDGTHNVYVAHANFTVYQKIPILYPDGSHAKNLNELEYANGRLYANVYLTPYILEIDIDEGKITKIYNLKELQDLVYQTQGFQNYQNNIGNCLNGIAYYKWNNTFWLTGKLWPYFWEVSLE